MPVEIDDGSAFLFFFFWTFWTEGQVTTCHIVFYHPAVSVTAGVIETVHYWPRLSQVSSYLVSDRMEVHGEFLGGGVPATDMTLTAVIIITLISRALGGRVVFALGWSIFLCCVGYVAWLHFVVFTINKACNGGTFRKLTNDLRRKKSNGSSVLTWFHK